MDLVLQKCTPRDLHTLRDLSIKTYRETFAPQNTPENMDAYLSSAFAPKQLLGELEDPNCEFFLLYAGGTLAGYMKLNEVPSQTDLNDPESLQLERLYVTGSFQGMKLGQYLMDTALGTARARNKKYVWLGAWEHNPRALRFYDKNGFYKIGSHSFFMGDDEQTDFLLRKDLT